MKNKYIVLAVLICLPFLGSIDAWVGGAFTETGSENIDSCIVRTDIFQPEDMVYSKKLGGLIISSSQMSHYKANKDPGLYLLKDNGDMTRLYQPDDYTFLPQGLGIYEKDDEAYLFIVNHHPDGDEVIRLSWFIDSGKPWVDHFKLEGYKKARDVAPYGKDKFIVTHDKKMLTDKFINLQSFFRLRSGYLTQFDGETLKKLSPNIQGPLGIAIDIDKKLAYVAGFYGKRVKIYEFGGEGFFRKETILVPGHPYYLSLSESSLLVAIQPNTFSLQEFTEGKAVMSPWKVVDINLESKKLIEKISSTGDKVSAIGSAIRVGSKIYGTGLFQKKLLVCDE